MMNEKKSDSEFSIEPVDDFQREHLRKVERMRKEIYKNMFAEDKLKEFEKPWYEAKRLKASHFREIHPEWSEEKVPQKVRDWMLYVRT